MPDVRPKIHTPTATLSHKISTQIRIRSAFFLRRAQLLDIQIVCKIEKQPKTQQRSVFLFAIEFKIVFAQFMAMWVKRP